MTLLATLTCDGHRTNGDRCHASRTVGPFTPDMPVRDLDAAVHRALAQGWRPYSAGMHLCPFRGHAEDNRPTLEAR